MSIGKDPKALFRRPSPRARFNLRRALELLLEGTASAAAIVRECGGARALRAELQAHKRAGELGPLARLLLAPAEASLGRIEARTRENMLLSYDGDDGQLVIRVPAERLRGGVRVWVVGPPGTELPEVTAASSYRDPP